MANTNYKKIEMSFRQPETSCEYFTNKGFLKYDVTTRTFYKKNGDPTRVEVWFEEIEEFEDSAKVLIRYLAINHHPHVTAIVTSTSCEISEGLKSIVGVNEFLID